jgi:CheY-like chemotaxis protein
MNSHEEDPINVALQATVDSLANCHFLLLEDDRNDALFVKLAFARVERPTSYVICRNCSEAKAYLRGAGIYSDRVKFPFPDLIVSDFNVGPETALELLIDCQQDSWVPLVPLVILTGSAIPTSVQRQLQSRAREVLRKPMDITELTRMLTMLANRFAK